MLYLKKSHKLTKNVSSCLKCFSLWHFRYHHTTSLTVGFKIRIMAEVYTRLTNMAKFKIRTIPSNSMVHWDSKLVSLTLWQLLVHLFDAETGEATGTRIQTVSESVDWIRALHCYFIRHTCSPLRRAASGGRDQLTLIKTILIVFSMALSCWWHTIQFTCCVP